MPVTSGCRRAYALVSVIALALLLLLPGILAGSAERAPSAAVRVDAAGVVAPCNGSAAPSTYSGSVQVEGTSPPVPSVAGVPIVLSYRIEQIFTPSGSSTPTVTCILSQAIDATSALGSFEFSQLVPGPSCDASGCTNSSGPFGPLLIGDSNGSPPGYFITSTIHGSLLSLTFVAALNRATIVPDDGTNTSANAPLSFHSVAVTGSGSSSPAILQYAWRLEGSGWSFVSDSASTSTTVRPAAGASTAMLALWVNGTFNGTTVHAPLVVANLIATATDISSASVDPTEVDPGAPVAFTVKATGSVGFSYAASLDPGLNESDLRVACTTSPISGATVRISCAATVSYPAPGIAHPSVNVSNGYSWDSRSFGSVAVANNLSVDVNPSPLQGYANASLLLVVSVPPGVGSPPYGPACLWEGDGTTVCQSTPGTSWEFAPTYAETGNYSARVTVADSSAQNRSLPVSVEIFPMLNATTPTPTSTNLSIGVASILDSVLRGGVAPFAYWWNASNDPSPFASGTAAVDGEISANFVPFSEGEVAVTFTVRDHLGTLRSSTALLVVGAGSVARLWLSTTVPLPGVLAGSGLTIDWTAENRYGDPVPNFFPEAGLHVSTSTDDGLSALWVNSTLTGSLAVSAPGFYLIPGADWVNGQLNLTVSSTLVGNDTIVPVWLASSESSISLQNDSVRWEVVPESSAIHLFDPRVVVPGSRTNATLYRIADPFGNPVIGAVVDVRSLFDGVTTTVPSRSFGNDSGTNVWVNYTSVGNGSGLVFVLSSEGISLLPPIEVPAAAAGTHGPVTNPLSAAEVPAGLLAILGGTTVLLLFLFRAAARRRSRPPPHAEASEDDLRRYALGCSIVVERIRDNGPLDPAGLANGWKGPFAPRRAELEEWVADLVADGTLCAVVGPDGATRFGLPPIASGPEVAPRVDLDPTVLARALARLERTEEPDPSASARPDAPPPPD